MLFIGLNPKRFGYGMHVACLLDVIEVTFPSVFIKSIYPVWENRITFAIPLIDSAN